MVLNASIHPIQSTNHSNRCRMLAIKEGAMITVEVQAKDVYGIIRFYPLNDNTKLILEIKGKKTFEHKDLEILKRLGFRVELTDLVGSVQWL